MEKLKTLPSQPPQRPVERDFLLRYYKNEWEGDFFTSDNVYYQNHLFSKSGQIAGIFNSQTAFRKNLTQFFSCTSSLPGGDLCDDAGAATATGRAAGVPFFAIHL